MNSLVLEGLAKRMLQDNPRSSPKIIASLLYRYFAARRLPVRPTYSRCYSEVVRAIIAQEHGQ